MLRDVLFRPDRARFAALVVDAFRRAGVDGDIDVGEDQFTLVLPTGTRCFLGNVHHDYCAAWPWQRPGVIRRYVSMAVSLPAELPAELDEVRDRLLPGVRDAFMLDYMRLQCRLHGETPAAPAGRPVGPRMTALLYVDEADRTQMVNAEHLQLWGIEFDDAMTLALGNLRARSGGGWHQPRAGLYVSPWRDCYDPSRMLLPEVLRPLEVDGDLVALAPNWNSLLVTGSDDEQALDAAMVLAERSLGEGRAVSALPVVYRWPEWRPLELPRGHPCFERWRRLRAVEMHSVYGDQKGIMEVVHREQGDEVEVADFTVLADRRSGSVVQSYATWERGVRTLLPETESIVFVDQERAEGERVLARVDLDIALLQCRPLMRDTEDTPRRFLVDGFPSPEQLAAMRRSQELRDG